MNKELGIKHRIFLLQFFVILERLKALIGSQVTDSIASLCLLQNDINKGIKEKAIIPNSLFLIRKSAGFTLIELLIVIAIIGVLSGLIMANFVGVRERARDGQRKANLRQIQSALELYRADKGIYPLTASFPDCGASLTDGTANSPIYMKKMPCDPLDSNVRYGYESGTGATYTLIACLENGNDIEKDRPKSSGCSTPASYTLTNP